MLHFSNLTTFVSIQLCIDVQIELNINNFFGCVGGEDTLFASERIRNSASNDKYLFGMLSVAHILLSRETRETEYRSPRHGANKKS